ncbi:MAG: hypothetical protein CBD97_01665 [Pelagibacteraceae bacterium TMED237]|nr:MAG: hypothetical protein CBD97_01665 [Pelagibacteraceae bacterium TMED237]|tara:strand:- start:18011 stop:19147 length:1137 start_codon:yes stop_codon:yes gene_type:complete
MISQKMIHYERILAAREFLKDMVDAHGYRGCIEYFRELNNVEKVFKECLSLDKEKKSKNIFSGSTEAWNTAFNNYFNRIKFLGSKMEGRKEEYHATITEQSRDEIKRQMLIMFLFYLSMKRVFRPTIELCNALNNTKNTTPFRELKLPYDTIYIEFPPGVYKVPVKHTTCGELDTTMQSLESAYVRLGEDMIIVSSNCTPSSKEYVIGQHSATMDIKISDKSVNVSEILDKCEENGLLLGRDALGTLLNIITYMSCTNFYMEKMNPPRLGKLNKKKFKKHSNRIKSRLPFYVIGGDIQISNKHNLGGEVTGTGRSLATRFMVRGHYHHFWKKRTEEITDNMVVKTREDGQVLIRKWIAPYWKGPEYGDVVLRDYKVTK